MSMVPICFLYCTCIKSVRTCEENVAVCSSFSFNSSLFFFFFFFLIGHYLIIIF